MDTPRAIDIHNALIGTVSSRADNSLRFSVETPELTPEQSVVLLRLRGVASRILIKPSDAEEVEEVKTDKETKTPSQRMRSALYRLWATAKEKGKTNMTFDVFYGKEMERIMQGISDRIEALN